MDESETTRLRALCDATELPWRAVDVVDGGTVLGRGTAILRPHSRWLVRRVAEVDMGDGEECDTSHAALIVAAVNALPGLLDAAERAERAERERDDLAAVLETRTAEHALAMARVTELEAIIAGRTTPPTDEGEGDGGETPAEIVARLRRHANEARRCAAWEHSQGMHLAAENSCRDARDFDAQADRMATAEVSRG